jgi:hypothetical protein
MRSRSYLGQAAPVKGAARLLAESLATSANGFTYSPKVSNPASTLYPGRMILRPEEVSLYVISFRSSFGGNVYLYEIEGPGQGNWKQVPISSLESYWVVSEPESGAVRDMAPTVIPNLPVGMENDALYPISLLEAAMAILGTTFPPMEGIILGTIDQSKIVAMASAAVSASTLAMSAIDGTGIAYDTLVIGRKAMLLLNYVAVTVLGTSLELINYTTHPEDPNNIAKACSKVFELSKRFELFGLYLERAYYWARLDDVTDLKLLRDNALLYMSEFTAKLNQINTNKDQLISNGRATQEEIANGLLMGRKYLQAYWAIDTAFSKQLGDALTAEKLTSDDLVYSATTIPLLLEMNKKAITDIQAGPGNIQGIQDLDGLGFFGAGPSGRTPKIEKAVLDRYNSVTAEMEKMISRDIRTSDPRLYDKYIEMVEKMALEGGILKGLFDSLTTRLATLSDWSKAVEFETLTKGPEMIVVPAEGRYAGTRATKLTDALFLRLEDLTEKLRNTPSSPPNEGYLVIAREIYNVRETLQYLETDASGIKPNIVARFRDYERVMSGPISADVKTKESRSSILTPWAPSYEAVTPSFHGGKLSSYIQHQLSLIMLPGARKLFYAREGSPDFLEIARQLVTLRDTLRFSDASMRAIIDSIADNSNLDQLAFRGELAKACYDIVATATASYQYGTTDTDAFRPEDFRLIKTANIPVLEYNAEMNKYITLIDISSAPSLRGLSRDYIELTTKARGRVDPMTGHSVVVPVDPVMHVIIKAYRAELDELHKTPDYLNVIANRTEADVEAMWNNLPGKRAEFVRNAGVPAENANVERWSDLQEPYKGTLLEYLKKSVDVEVDDADKDLAEAETNLTNVEAVTNTGAAPTQEQTEALAASLVRAEESVQAVTFKTRFKAAVSRVFVVLRSIGKLRTVGPTKVYRFISKIGWKKIALALGIGGLILSVVVLAIKNSGASLPYDPKADSPPFFEGVDLGSVLTSLGIAAGALAGAYYLLNKGVPLIKDWWAKKKTHSIPQAAAGLSGLPRRRKRKKPAPKRSHKRRQTYPGPGKNFMEMM